MSGQRKASELMRRVATALILVPPLLVVIWLPGMHTVFTLFVAFFLGVALHEFFTLARAEGIATEHALGIAFGVSLVLVGLLPNASPDNTMPVLAGGIALISAWSMLRGERSLRALGVSVLGVVYVGWFGAHVAFLHAQPGRLGPALVTLLFAAVIFSDTLAYFAGRAMGRHKLAPQVSPNKTWEGAIGGVAGAMAGLAGVWALSHHVPSFGFPKASLGVYLATGAVLAALSQVGDLVESMMKRSAGIKDAGGIFPGHGGVLDRCDGILFTAPILYYGFQFLAPWLIHSPE